MSNRRRRIIVSAALPATALGLMLAGSGLASASPMSTPAAHTTTASTISLASPHESTTYRHHRGLDLNLGLNLNLSGHDWNGHDWNGDDCGYGDDGGYYNGGYYNGGLLGGIL